MPSFFITGTDTGVGKTWFTCWLARNWLAHGHTVATLKPISTGDREDAVLLCEASGNALTLDEINPIHFREPVAPLLAAQMEHRLIDFAPLNSHIEEYRTRVSHLAVEGVGGWRVPLAPGHEVRDWAKELGLPVVVVALNRLGMINHTLLTVESIRAAGLTCAGVVVNEGPETNPDTSPDFDLARLHNIALLREFLLLPIFEFDRRAHAAGEVPVWLGGKEI